MVCLFIMRYKKRMKREFKSNLAMQSCELNREQLSTHNSRWYLLVKRIVLFPEILSWDCFPNIASCCWKQAFIILQNRCIANYDLNMNKTYCLIKKKHLRKTKQMYKIRKLHQRSNLKQYHFKSLSNLLCFSNDLSFK